MAAELQPLIDKVWRHCELTGTRGRTVTLKVKFADFEIITRSRSVSSVVANRDDLAQAAISLLKDHTPFSKAVRLLGVSLSSLQGGDDAEPSQLAFGI
jgi:DNA polymerase IV